MQAGIIDSCRDSISDSGANRAKSLSSSQAKIYLEDIGAISSTSYLSSRGESSFTLKNPIDTDCESPAQCQNGDTLPVNKLRNNTPHDSVVSESASGEVNFSLENDIMTTNIPQCEKNVDESTLHINETEITNQGDIITSFDKPPTQGCPRAKMNCSLNTSWEINGVHVRTESLPPWSKKNATGTAVVSQEKLCEETSNKTSTMKAKNLEAGNNFCVPSNSRQYIIPREPNNDKEVVCANNDHNPELIFDGKGKTKEDGNGDATMTFLCDSRQSSLGTDASSHRVEDLQEVTAKVDAGDNIDSDLKTNLFSINEVLTDKNSDENYDGTSVIEDDEETVYFDITGLVQSKINRYPIANDSRFDSSTSIVDDSSNSSEDVPESGTFQRRRNGEFGNDDSAKSSPMKIDGSMMVKLQGTFSTLDIAASSVAQLSGDSDSVHYRDDTVSEKPQLKHTTSQNDDFSLTKRKDKYEIDLCESLPVSGESYDGCKERSLSNDEFQLSLTPDGEAIREVEASKDSPVSRDNASDANVAEHRNDYANFDEDSICHDDSSVENLRVKTTSKCWRRRILDDDDDDDNDDEAEVRCEQESTHCNGHNNKTTYDAIKAGIKAGEHNLKEIDTGDVQEGFSNLALDNIDRNKLNDHDGSIGLQACEVSSRLSIDPSSSLFLDDGITAASNTPRLEQSDLSNILSMKLRDMNEPATKAVIDVEAAVDEESTSSEEYALPGDEAETVEDEDTTHFDGCWTECQDSEDLHLSGNIDSSHETNWPHVRLPRELYFKLFDHQRVGVQWMASLHKNEIRGGILADDMGMGKTMQTVAYLGSLMRAREISNALIVCPTSVVRSWEREANSVLKGMCVPRARVKTITSDINKQKRKRLFTEAFCSHHKYPHIAITTYGLISSQITDLNEISSAFQGNLWHYVILDEGHTIKNSSTKIARSVRILCRNKKTRRLLLTGTPIQNNLRELHSLFDWATSGKLLGSLQTFLNKYGVPIEDGRQKNASDWTIKTAARVNRDLQEKLRPHFLQRLKKSEFNEKLPDKKELVVFTHLSSKQRDMYERFLGSGRISSVLSGETASPLAAITWLKKLCGHPSLIKESSHEYEGCEAEDLLKDSSKLQVLLSLIYRLKRSNHRTLIFSQSTKMLDIMEKVFDSSIKYSRIDGSTKEKRRQKVVDEFNCIESDVDLMLLSTTAAGIGLTLTGADRAIIYDPSWNPAQDAQAVDRCYRIGQTRSVTVYRFISAGTVEEKMYEKQIHKDGIRRVVLTSGGTSTARYFDQSELRELFKLGQAGECAMLNKFYEKSTNLALATATPVKSAVGSSGKPSFLSKHPQVVGVSSHDLLYSNVTVDLTSPTSPSAPFSQTPMKETSHRNRWMLQGNRKLNFDVVSIDESLTRKYEIPDQRLRVADNALRPLGKGLNRTRQNRNETRAERNGDKVATASRSINRTQIILSKVDTMLASGRHDEGINLLFDLLKDKNFPLQGEAKLSVHGKISSVARSLGWL